MAMDYQTKIESIRIKNYRVFQDAVFNKLPRMSVFIGANGSGKSTFFDVFTFLKEALNENVAVAVARRGGFRELVSRDSTGPIELTIKFRESGGRLASYQLIITEADGRAVVDRESAELSSWTARVALALHRFPARNREGNIQ